MLTQKELELIEAAAERASRKVKEELNHECFFSTADRANLKDLLLAIKTEGADHETHTILYRIGNGIRNATKRIAAAMVWAVIIGAGALVLAAVGRGIYLGK